MRLSLLVACLWLATGPLWGKIVFYSKQAGNYEIYMMDSSGNGQVRLTFNEATDVAPVWSPNGRQIAFHSFRDDHKDPHKHGGESNAEIYVMDADGGNQRRLTHYPGLDNYADWHPNSSQIAFTSTRNENFNIFVMDADGSNIKQITDLEFASTPKWSPDGKRMAFEGVIGNGREIFVINANGTGRFKVSKPRPYTRMHLGGWSPDGKRILYKETVDSNLKNSFAVIATLNLVGRRKVKRWYRVPVPRLPFQTTTFAGDGKSILFSGKRNNDSNIYRFHLTDRKLIQLTDNPGPDAGPHEWNPRLSVRPRQSLSLFWGEIRSEVLRP